MNHDHLNKSKLLYDSMSNHNQQENQPKNNRWEHSPYAVGYEWSVRVSTIGLEMALPPVFGVWLDSKCGTLILFTVLGAALGMTTALIRLIRLGKESTNSSRKNGDTSL